MDWIIAVSDKERASGNLLSETAHKATEALQMHGAVLLRGVFSPAMIDGLHREFALRYGDYDLQQMQEQSVKPPPNSIAPLKGQARFEIVMRMSGAFGAPDLFANNLLCDFLGGVLGKDMRLSGFTTVVSYPGASMQQIHRDHPHLFDDPLLGPSLPAYSVSALVPLLDVDLAMGPTGIWLGSHRWPENHPSSSAKMTMVPFERGDCILLDYRLIHTGVPNTSDRVRPILYMVYASSWFFDEINHVGRWPLDMSLTEFGALPASAQQIAQRAHSRSMRAR